jgi:putative DNA primase/helicase
LDFSSWLKGEFSAEALIGKKVGIFPDVRFKEAKWYGQNLDPGGLDHSSKGMLLKIIGGDGHTLARKWNTIPWKGVLPMKLTLISNQVPNLNDQILAAKFIKIAFNVSFFGREDLDLEKKLTAELPGIANRCLEGYRRLCRRSKLIQPRSGLKLAKELIGKTNPWQKFFDDVCVLDRNGILTFSALYLAFLSWCDENERPDMARKVPMSTHLSRILRNEVEVFNSLQEYRPEGGKRSYLGIRLRTAADNSIPDVDVSPSSSVSSLVNPLNPLPIRLKHQVTGFRRRF